MIFTGQLELFTRLSETGILESFPGCPIKMNQDHGKLF